MKANIPPKLKLSNRKDRLWIACRKRRHFRADLTRMTGISGGHGGKNH